MTPYSDSRHETEAPSGLPSRRKQSGRKGSGKADKSGGGRPRVWTAELRDWVRTLAIAALFVLLLHTFVFNLSTVDGRSMEPTLADKMWLFVDKYAYRFGPPERGDVVIFRDPSDDADKKEFLVKRIIGVPGDTIEIRSGQLYRNGELVVEPYTDTKIEDSDFGPLKVEEGRFFVMGDNRRTRASKDSRSFGSVPRGLIQGRADFILWPIAGIHKL